MGSGWRFFVDARGKWTWEELSPSGAVRSSSTRVFDTCEAAIAAAEQHGYRYLPSPPKTKVRFRDAGVERASRGASPRT